MSETNTIRALSSKFVRSPHLILQPIDSIQNQQLLPIYDKVALLRQEMHSREGLKKSTVQNNPRPQIKQKFLEIGIDRNRDIELSRKRHSASQNRQNQQKITKDKKSQTSSNWKEHHRNKTKSLVNFLQNNHKINQRPITNVKQSKVQIREREIDNQQFQPVGQLYQESIKGSETQSLSSFRPDSSLQLSKRNSGSSRQSPRKYLRKGNRVREILMKQLNSDDRGGSPPTMTYLKEYDQWVPSTYVQEKKAELETFLNIIYGDKKSKDSNQVDLNKINLVYL